MERTITLTPEQQSLLLDLVKEDYARQQFPDTEHPLSSDVDLVILYQTLSRKLTNENADCQINCNTIFE